VSAHLRPVAPDGRRYPSYAAAMAAADPPALFENRPTYRLLGANLADGGEPALWLARGRYFDSVSVAEALGHELAAAMPADGPVPPIAGLPFRAAVGDPCDLARRPAGVAISTLTLRRSPGGGATFPLHWRDPAKVGHAGGLYQVIPVGVFQPIGDGAETEQADLSLWRAIVREFSEELLGSPEDYAGDGGRFRYENWDFYRSLSAARDRGALRVWCLGLGVDPLTLVADLLTVAVFDPGLFDSAFGDLVTGNAEGQVIAGRDRTGFPFTGPVVARLTGGAEPIQAAGAAVLRLAWAHRAELLG
jgi:hypothetical protein